MNGMRDIIQNGCKTPELAGDIPMHWSPDLQLGPSEKPPWRCLVKAESSSSGRHSPDMRWPTRGFGASAGFVRISFALSVLPVFTTAQGAYQEEEREGREQRG